MTSNAPTQTGKHRFCTYASYQARYLFLLTILLQSVTFFRANANPYTKEKSRDPFPVISNWFPLPVRIEGEVTDSTGQPLSGATIQVKGTTNAVKSDARGHFVIEAGADATLVISYIGFATKEIEIQNQTHITVQLESSAALGDQVVVIGYGTQRKKTLTGAISVIDNDALKNRPAAKTTDLLQGVSAGLQISRNNTGNIRGSQNQITIRGITSRSSPGVLVVIDGIPQTASDASALDNINPDDIDNISILKDGQAAIYGARAAGGVILITTKTGQSGKPIIRFSTDQTIQKPSLMRKPTNILQLFDMQNEGYVNDGQSTNPFTGVVTIINDNNITFDKIKNNDQQYLMRDPYGNDHPYYLGHYDWNDIMFNPSLQQNYNISVSGRKDRLTYYESVNYLDQDGMLAYGSNYKKRLLVTLKNDYDINSFLKVKSNIRIGTQKMVEPYNYTGGGYGGLQGILFFTMPTLEPFTKGGHYMDIGGFYDPVAAAEAGGTTTDLSYTLRGTLGAEIRPFKNFLVAGELSANYDMTETDWASLDWDMYDALDNFVQSAYGGLNQAGTGYNRTKYTVGNVTASYNFTNLGDHRLKLLAGYSAEGNNYRTFSAYRRYGLISPGLPTMGAGAANEQYNSEDKNAYSLNSAYSRLEYSFKDRYLLEGIFRYDGSSKFAKGYKWSPFTGLSGGWVISGEPFMRNLEKIVDLLKLRASWGQLGNQTGIGLYDYLYQINVGGGYPMGNWTSPIQSQMATLGTLPSTTRTWEKIESKNLGVDFSILRSRLTGSVDVYIKDNKNMFFNQEFPQVLGATAPNINGAYLRTKGWELELGWKDKIKDFDYFLKLNLSNSTTNVKRLADAGIAYQGANQFVEGYPYMSYFGFAYDGLIQTNSDLDAYNAYYTSGIPGNLKLGDARFKDLNGDHKLTALPYEVGADGKPTANSGDLVKFGEGAQHYFFGITLGASWKNFDFRAFFQGVLKWDVISNIVADNQWYEPNEQYLYHQTWAPDRISAMWPRLSQDGTIKGYNYQYSDAPYKLFNNKYVRLKNIQLGYNLPARMISRLGISQLRVYFSGTDIWEHTNLSGNQDPETPFTLNLSPFPRQYAFGLSLTL